MISRTLFQPLPHFLRRQPRYTNHFPAAALAGRYGNGGTRNLQKICQEFDARLVGLAFNWRRCQREFKRATDLASDDILLRPRVDFDCEARAGRCFLNGNQECLSDGMPKNDKNKDYCDSHIDQISRHADCIL